MFFCRTGNNIPCFAGISTPDLKKNAFFPAFRLQGNKNSSLDSRIRNSFCVMTCHSRLTDLTDGTDWTDKCAEAEVAGKMPSKNPGDLTS